MPVLPATGKRSSGKPANAEAAVPAAGTVRSAAPMAARSPGGSRTTEETRGWMVRRRRPLTAALTSLPTWGAYTVPPLAMAP